MFELKPKKGAARQIYFHFIMDTQHIYGGWLFFFSRATLMLKQYTEKPSQ